MLTRQRPHRALEFLGDACRRLVAASFGQRREAGQVGEHERRLPVLPHPAAAAPAPDDVHGCYGALSHILEKMATPCRGAAPQPLSGLGSILHDAQDADAMAFLPAPVHGGQPGVAGLAVPSGHGDAVVVNEGSDGVVRALGDANDQRARESRHTVKAVALELPDLEPGPADAVERRAVAMASVRQLLALVVS